MIIRFRIQEKLKQLYRKAVAIRLDGIGVIEIILILVIIIGIVLIFRNQIAAIIKAAFDSIKSDTSQATAEIVIPTLGE